MSKFESLLNRALSSEHDGEILACISQAKRIKARVSDSDSDISLELQKAAKSIKKWKYTAEHYYDKYNKQQVVAAALREKYVKLHKQYIALNKSQEYHAPVVAWAIIQTILVFSLFIIAVIK